MERSQPHLPQKSSSFSSTGRSDEKHRDIDRNLSLGRIKFEGSYEKKDRSDNVRQTIEEDENENDKNEEEAQELSFTALSSGIDDFLGSLTVGGGDDGHDRSSGPPEIPETTIEKFVTFVEKEIAKYESSEEKWSSDNDELSLLGAIDRVSKLTTAVTNFSSVEPKYNHAMNLAGSVLHQSMAFLEEEFYSLLDDPRAKQDPGSNSSKTKRPPSFSRSQDSDRCVQPSPESNSEESGPPYPPETMERLHGIADAMITAGYVTECCQVFTVARRNAIEAALTSTGFEKISIDDVLKMPWESLEGEITKWIKAFRHMITVSFINERDLCDAIFAGHREMSHGLFHNLARGITIQLLTFAEAVAMTKRSAEKLFKMLDMYEILRDVLPAMDGCMPANADQTKSSPVTDVKSEISLIQSRLGEAAVAIFCDLESSIKSDVGKTPVPGGAVHPLTRYVMNYLKYACEYKNTLEQVFKDHKNSNKTSANDDDREDAPQQNGSGAGDNGDNRNGCDSNSTSAANPFAAQLIEVMDLLHLNMEAKSKLYKDLALSNIFLMNNGRYIMQKIKGSSEIHQLLGNQWSRKRSTELRQYHKNYQRETWSKVLACFKDEGLQVKGSVAKPVLKERFKSFNAMFEEIHKTQSSWVVSDEQLQSELRVSISAVIVPAYRSFLGRYSQHLLAGRQSEKYIKFGAEDLESFIDELFDGNPSSLLSRKRT